MKIFAQNRLLNIWNITWKGLNNEQITNNSEKTRETRNLHCVRRHEHGQQRPCRLCIAQTMIQIAPSWFRPPYSGSCSCYTTASAWARSTTGSQFCSLWRAQFEAIGTAECTYLVKKGKQNLVPNSWTILKRKATNPLHQTWIQKFILTVCGVWCKDDDVGGGSLDRIPERSRAVRSLVGGGKPVQEWFEWLSFTLQLIVHQRISFSFSFSFGSKVGSLRSYLKSKAFVNCIIIEFTGYIRWFFFLIFKLEQHQTHDRE